MSRLHNGEGWSLEQTALGKLDIYMQKNELDPHHVLYTKSPLKWIKDLNLRPETIKLKTPRTKQRESFITLALVMISWI